MQRLAHLYVRPLLYDRADAGRQLAAQPEPLVGVGLLYVLYAYADVTQTEDEAVRRLLEEASLRRPDPQKRAPS
jgi:predicted phosphoribosyltransferase